MTRRKRVSWRQLRKNRCRQSVLNHEHESPLNRIAFRCQHGFVVPGRRSVEAVSGPRSVDFEVFGSGGIGLANRPWGSCIEEAFRRQRQEARFQSGVEVGW